MRNPCSRLAPSVLAVVALVSITADFAPAQALPETAVQRLPYYTHDYYDALDVYGRGSGYYPGTDYPVYPMESYGYDVDPYDAPRDPYRRGAELYDRNPYDGVARFRDPDPELGDDTVLQYYDAIPDIYDYGGYDYLGYDRSFNYDAYDAHLDPKPALEDDRMVDPFDTGPADRYEYPPY